MASLKLFLAFIAVEAVFALDKVYDPKPGLLDVLATLKLTKFADGLKNCSLDRVINHEGTSINLILVLKFDFIVSYHARFRWKRLKCPHYWSYQKAAAVV